MGEVYRARDTRLYRAVAIEILPDLFATDAERVARFQRRFLVNVLTAMPEPTLNVITNWRQMAANSNN